GREASRSRLQDLIGPAQFPLLPLQTLEPLPLIRPQPRLSALIDLHPPHPLTDRLRRRTQLLGNRNDRLPLRIAMLLSLEHHPNSPIPQLHRIPPQPLLVCHDSILSRSGACALLGEVHVLASRGIGPAPQAVYGSESPISHTAPCRKVSQGLVIPWDS